jgi:TM2 domain-containing membrane protein YozV
MMGGDPDGFLLGTAEREQVLHALGAHLEAGRLTLDQYDQRVTAAIAASTRGELRPLFHDLPPPYPPFMGWAHGPVYAPPPSLGNRESDKSQLAAGLLELLVPMGAGRFYLGHNTIGACQAMCALGAWAFFGQGLWTIGVALLVWSFVDAVVLLTVGGTDSYGRKLR